MQEVVKKEINKLLDSRVIYPIADSSCAYHVQSVPKKEGMIVVRNEENELFPIGR